jgi:hypothetical protein
VERLRFIEHKGRRILLMDCSANSRDEAYAIFDAFDALIRKQPPKSTLVLCNFENAYHDMVILSRWKKASPEHEAYVIRTANVGIGGTFKVAMAAYRFFARLSGVEIDALMRDFKDDEAAKDWLLESFT